MGNGICVVRVNIIYLVFPQILFAIPNCVVMREYFKFLLPIGKVNCVVPVCRKQLFILYSTVLEQRQHLLHCDFQQQHPITVLF